MSLNDKILNSILQVQTEMLQVSRSHYEDDILPIINKIRIDLAKQLENLDIAGIRKMEDLSRIKRLSEMFKQTDKIITDYYYEISKVNEESVIEAGRYTVDFIERKMNQFLGDTMVKAISLKKIEKITTSAVFGSENNKHTAGFWWKRQSAYLRKLYRNKVGSLVASDAPIKEVITAIRGTVKNNFTDGIMNITYKQAKALARSSIVNTSNACRNDMYQSNDDIVKGIVWVSTLDGRTSDICIALDGKKWDNEYNPVGHGFPYPGDTAHFACRSTQAPWLKSYSELTGRKKEIAQDEGLRSSMNGYAPRSKKYSQFLREQGAEFQNKVLGVERAKLFRDGKITTDDLINKDFEKVPLKQLSKK